MVMLAVEINYFTYQWVARVASRRRQACINSDIKARNPVAEQKMGMCVGIWRALSHM